MKFIKTIKRTLIKKLEKTIKILKKTIKIQKTIRKLITVKKSKSGGIPAYKLYKVIVK